MNSTKQIITKARSITQYFYLLCEENVYSKKLFDQEVKQKLTDVNVNPLTSVLIFPNFKHSGFHHFMIYGNYQEDLDCQIVFPKHYQTTFRLFDDKKHTIQQSMHGFALENNMSTLLHNPYIYFHTGKKKYISPMYT